MHWFVLAVSLASLLCLDGGIVSAKRPERVTVPILTYFPATVLDYSVFTLRKGESGPPKKEVKEREITWYGFHPTPKEILDYGMDPRSPDTNEWIARAHYKSLVQQFEEWKKHKAKKPESEWRLYKAGAYDDEPGDPISGIEPFEPQAIEALFDYDQGTLTVACLYDPILKRHFVSTVPRGKKAREILGQGKSKAPLWWKAFSLAGQKPKLHAEDHAYFIFEREIIRQRLVYENGNQYKAGHAIGAWGGRSDYKSNREDPTKTKTDPEGSRYNLCQDGADSRGVMGCNTVATNLGVAFNGPKSNSRYCRRDGKPLYIRGREIACEINPKGTSKGSSKSSLPSGTANASKPKSTGARKLKPTNTKKIVTTKPTQIGPKQHAPTASKNAGSAAMKGTHASTSNAGTKGTKGTSNTSASSSKRGLLETQDATNTAGGRDDTGTKGAGKKGADTKGTSTSGIGTKGTAIEGTGTKSGKTTTSSSRSRSF